MKVKGYLKTLKRKFEIEVDAKSKNEAIEKTYSFFGAKMGIKRNALEIIEVV